MSMRRLVALLAALVACILSAGCRVSGRTQGQRCAVRVRIDGGWVCGARRFTDTGLQYASFRGVPYAKQPLGELRFKELQPVEPWEGLYDATDEGPACPQADLFYGGSRWPQRMSEACIHANVHVPVAALPGHGARPARDLQPPRGACDAAPPGGLPILVYIHGGGFGFGSGDSDVHGPEFLVNKDVVVVTFNYRLNVFGFLSLNTSSVPGNNGLRDAVTLLRWVRRNAARFGGDPDNVTLAGHSAGSCMAHLLSLSPVSEGLFKRAILMSGVGVRTFYSTSPVFAQSLASQLLGKLGITATDPEEIHRRLVEAPLDDIVRANSELQDSIGVTSFTPVVESSLPNVTRILDADPEQLMAGGRGSNVPLIIGFVTAECETFRSRFKAIDMLKRIEENPLFLLSPYILYNVSLNEATALAKKQMEEYFSGNLTMNGYITSCSENYFMYPAMKTAELRAAGGGAPVYLYQFGFEGDFTVLKKANGLQYCGAGHGDDVSYVFRANHVLDTFHPPIQARDYLMREWMTKFVSNFMRCSKPTCEEGSKEWPPVRPHDLSYQDIETPGRYRQAQPTQHQRDVLRHYDAFYGS